MTSTFGSLSAGESGVRGGASTATSVPLPEDFALRAPRLWTFAPEFFRGRRLATGGAPTASRFVFSSVMANFPGLRKGCGREFQSWSGHSGHRRNHQERCRAGGLGRRLRRPQRGRTIREGKLVAANPAQPKLSAGFLIPRKAGRQES